ncbi:excalibur calcium-binding domain-containing protein [Streptococcus suis]|nr:excalibur calcium-binding domain-containing protein [Streptococcus suis]NQH96786.1 excalibur calcium-binding domain-containing protein [Streptococcus suis]
MSEVATETDDISKNGQVSVIEIDGKAWDSQKDTVYKKNSKVVIKYWNAEKAIAEKARKEEEERQAAEAKRIAEERAAAQAQAAAQSQGQIHGFAQAPASNVYYPNCKAARAAGAAPVYQGQPGYGSHLDRDGDGIGCE